jgi:two-component system sensor histidine kinase RegB
MWLGFIVITVLIAWVIIGLLKSIKAKDEQLNIAKLKQAKNDKILALATLATGSAHELGTPLATINFITDELLNNADTQPYHRQLNLLKQQVYRCKESLTNITASTGTTQAIGGKKKTLKKFISDIIKSESIFENVIFNKQNLFNPSAEIITDKTLKQAITNIINNAIESGATKVKVIINSNKENLSIDIIDNGKGFNQALDIQNNSEKDFGMGLGLFLAHATIERFKGKISKINTEHQGSHLQINLPIL